MSFLSKIFGDSNERVLGSYREDVAAINAREEEYRNFSPEKVREAALRFKERLAGGETFDDILPDAFAAVREASRRVLAQRHFDVQLLGGIVLHQGKIAEMKTGEGKTLVATLPLYLNSLAGKGAHLVTPNDYLARIGAGWMGPVYEALGVSVAVITHEWSGIFDPTYTDPQKHADARLNHFRPSTRREAYEADITYGTNNEFGFDYLRDNLEYEPSSLRQRSLHYAIVDEVDSILIDEARTPLIISSPDEESADLYKTFARLTPQLKEDADYNVDEKLKAVTITEEGINKVEKLLGVENIYEEKGFRFVRYLESALRAKTLFHRDRDYVVKDGEVVIVDEFTGRLMPGRRWSEGLHQAIEAKEGVDIKRESRTLATVTFQNYFRMYEKLAGMTGTAETSAEEFHKVYGLEVVRIPTHRPMIRHDLPDLVFRTEAGKFRAVVRETKERHKKGQPVLIGTVSIEKNERLSKMLSVEGIAHELLNAKNHEREAMIIAQAGRWGAVTVATNMAGRGVDIILGGSPLYDSGSVSSLLEDSGEAGSPGRGAGALANFSDAKDVQEVRRVGGLHVIGTERHEARRIDNQLRGRAGRQGDSGSSQFFVSFEDDLMRIFGSARVKRMMESFGIPEDQPIEHKIVSRAIEAAQAKIEGFHFDSRKHVLEYDDVLNKQRDAIYRMRRELLFGGGEGQNSNVKEKILEMAEEEIARIVEFHTSGGEWNNEEIFENIKAVAEVPDDIHGEISSIAASDQDEDIKKDALVKYLSDVFRQKYREREHTLGGETMERVQKAVFLRAIDTLWMDHLDQMEHLRDSVRLRAYGQRDPLVEYKNEGARLFRDLQQAIRTHVISTILKVGAAPRLSRQRGMEELRAVGENNAPRNGGGHWQEDSRVGKGQERIMGRISRNAPCPCGSGKKYKKCHGR